MDKENLHRQLKRQINKFLSEDLIVDNEAISKFIEVVNLSYMNYERDTELFEQSALLNDIEYFQINLKLKEELKEKEDIQNKLIYAIKQLNDTEIKLGNEDNLIDLLNILNKEIDSKKEFENELFVAKSNAEKANDAKSDFLSIMSHEIRTPLNAIIGLIYIMEKENSFASFQENIEVLKHSAQNLYLLINDILDFNKIEAGKIDIEHIPFDLEELISQIGKSLEVKAYENSNKIEIIIDKDFTPNIISDPLRIGQIMTNLVSNAIRYTPDAGAIDVKWKLNAEGQGEFSVKDSGPGIASEHLSRLTERFYRVDRSRSRDTGGTGLGLSIVKHVAAKHGGDVSVWSVPNVGSTFSLLLPIYEENEEQK